MPRGDGTDNQVDKIDEKSLKRVASEWDNEYLTNTKAHRFRREARS